MLKVEEVWGMGLAYLHLVFVKFREVEVTTPPDYFIFDQILLSLSCFRILVSIVSDLTSDNTIMTPDIQLSF